MENNIISYEGKKYKFIANVCYTHLFNYFDENDNTEELDRIFGNHETDKFIELIETLGDHKHPMISIEDYFDDCFEVAKHDNFIIVMGEDMMGDEEYDLYELVN